jgi:hypothetical protein
VPQICVAARVEVDVIKDLPDIGAVRYERDDAHLATAQ